MTSTFRHGYPHQRVEGRLSTTATLILDKVQQAAMFEHARRSYPDECCGAIFGRLDGEQRAIVELRELENTWDPVERRRRFLITPREFTRVEREADERGLTLLGFYHSHPDAAPRPSEFDREHAWPWFVYPIVGVQGGEPVEIRAWRLRDERDGYDELPLRPGED
jgi:proteasome lid subunit RPN8/RPN11